MMSTDLGLSERGNELRQSSSQSFADYLMEHFRRMSNPDYIALCIAENRLMWPELSAQLDNIGLGCLEAGDLCYGDDTGLNYFKRNLLEFLRSWIVGNEVNWKPDDMIIMNGCGSVLSMLFFVICDPGDVVLVPSPLYWGFYNDLKTIPKAEMEAVPMDMEKGFYLEVSRFEEAYARVSRSGKKCSALLLSSPQNPTGRVYGKEELESIVSWAESKKIHVIMDEIYALSQMKRFTSIEKEQPFVSIAKIRPDLGNYVHFVWGFSKDLAMSGARVGFLISKNKGVIDAIRCFTYWFEVSGITQRVLSALVSDAAFCQRYINELSERLTSSRDATIQCLESYSIPYFKGLAGIFLWADFSSFLKESTFEEETKFWRFVLNESNVNLTPGRDCFASSPGWMRICFAAEPIERLKSGLEKFVVAAKKYKFQ